MPSASGRLLGWLSVLPALLAMAWLLAGLPLLPIPQARGAFGGTHHALTFASPAFYQVSGTIVPQFMVGLPMVIAAGYWVGGVGAAVMPAPVLGAAAVLTFGGLAARLVGPRWAPLAALVLALSWPEQYTSRSTFSEPLAQILFLGGLCLVIDSLAADGTGARVAAGLGGVALGLTVLVRIDGRPGERQAPRRCGRAGAVQALPCPHQERTAPAAGRGGGRAHIPRRSTGPG